jgi:hypothetical protein
VINSEGVTVLLVEQNVRQALTLAPTEPAFWRVDGWSFKVRHATCCATNVSSVRI